MYCKGHTPEPIRLDDNDNCPECIKNRVWPKNLAEKKARLQWNIIWEALDKSCIWSDVAGATELVQRVGLNALEIEATIRELKFRRKDPLIELTEEQQQEIGRLEERGLTVKRLDCGPWRQGFMIYKKKGVAGNTRKGYESRFLENLDDEGDIFDAPLGHILPDADGAWHFEVHVFVPIGPGDFLNSFQSLRAAVDDVIDYYFISQVRMNPYSLQKLEAERQERAAARESGSAT